MIADGLILYLEFKYGDNVCEFLIQMRFWKRRVGFGTMRGKSIVNPLSKELDGLEALDNYYDFSVAPDKIKDQKTGCVVKNNVPKTAAELAAA